MLAGDDVGVGQVRVATLRGRGSGRRARLFSWSPGGHRRSVSRGDRRLRRGAAGAPGPLCRGDRRRSAAVARPGWRRRSACGTVDVLARLLPIGRPSASVCRRARRRPDHARARPAGPPLGSGQHLLVPAVATRHPRERIVEHLRDLSIATPTAPLPRQREIEWGPRVWFGRTQVRRVVDHLGARIPPGARWGFNYDGDRAWAIAEAEVDLAALVRAAIAA
jgi:hypothetical protein